MRVNSLRFACPSIVTANNGSNDPLILGHTVSTAAQASGVNTIMRSQYSGVAVLTGGTDPRREGIVLGDTFLP